MMRLFALTGAQENGPFTGVLEFGEHRLMIDAGVRFEPGPQKTARPDFSLLDERPPTAILLTHAHISHTGSLPLLVEKFPELPIFATQGTLSLLQVLFFEGMRSIERDQLAMEKESFLFRPQFLRQIITRIQAYPMGEVFQPIAGDASVQASYLPAGHVIGAGMLLLECEEGRVLVTGDCSLRSQRTIPGIALEQVPQADVMICDAIYGDAVHPPREEQEERLLEQVAAVVRRGGRALFPAFAVGRAQELFLLFRQAMAQKLLPRVPIYLDGAIRAVSQVFAQEKELLQPEFRAQLEDAEASPFDLPGEVIPVGSTAERRRIVRSGGQSSIIFSSSGMLEGGPSPVYAEAIASDRKSGLFLNAHHDDEYPGSAFFRCKQGDTLSLNKKRVVLNCDVVHYGYSTHLDAQEIRELVRYVQPQQLLLVQGEGTSLVRLGRQFPRVEVLLPQPEQPLELSFEQRAAAPVHEGEEPPALAEAPAVEAAPDPDAVPEVHDLYQAIVAMGDMERAWSVAEIAAGYFKKSFQSRHRQVIKKQLDFCEPHFIRQRHGSDWTYIPQAPEVVEQRQRVLERVKALDVGDLVLVQPLVTDSGPPRIGVVQRPLKGGDIFIVAETWKAPKQDWKVIRVIPGVRDASLTEGAGLPEFRGALESWREKVKGEVVDLISLWRSVGREAYTFEQLAEEYTSPEARLALGLELLDHGLLLWELSGDAWVPRAPDDLRIDPEVLQRHALLRQAGTSRVAHTDGRKGRLTGRIHWDRAEVLWDASTSFAPNERLSLSDEEEPPPPAIELPQEPQAARADLDDEPADPNQSEATDAIEAQKAELQDAKAPESPEHIEEPDDSDDSEDSDEADRANAADEADETRRVHGDEDDEDDEDDEVIARSQGKAIQLSPSALQKLLKEEGIQRPRKDIRRMERDELVKHFGSKRSGRIVFARLFRSLVWQAFQWIQKGKEPPVQGGMQTFWYRWCLPALKKAPEYKKMKFEPYDLMCRTFTQMVFELGLFSYADFGFTDLNQRNRMIGDNHPNILVFAEKAMWYPLLAELHERFGVSIIAFYGTPSSLTTEYTARELKAACGEDDELHLIGIVSYSPAGDIAARSFQHQLSRVGYPDTSLRTVIHPAHYTEDELKLFRVSIPSRQKTKLAHWMEKTCGINGEPYGLESESMPQERLKELLEKQIQEIAGD